MTKVSSLALLQSVLAGEKVLPSQIDDLLRVSYREDLHLDYKSGALEFEKDETKLEHRRDVTAFANSDGGMLILGINKRFEVDGFVPPGTASPAEWSRSVLHPIAAQFHPGVRFCEVLHSTGKTILIVAVGRNPTLIPIVERGRPGPSYYLRSGDSKFPAPDYMLADLFLGRRQSPTIQVSLEAGPGVFVQQTFSSRNLGTASPEARVYNLGFFRSRLEVSNIGMTWADELRCGIVGFSYSHSSGVRATAFNGAHRPLTEAIYQAVDFEDPDGLPDSSQPLKPQRFHFDLTGDHDSPPNVPPFGVRTFQTNGMIMPITAQWTTTSALYLFSRNCPPLWYQLSTKHALGVHGYEMLAMLVRAHERPLVTFKSQTT